LPQFIWSEIVQPAPPTGSFFTYYCTIKKAKYHFIALVFVEQTGSRPL